MLTDVAVVVTKTRSSEFDGMPPGPAAVTVETPVVVELSVTEASPLAFVVQAATQVIAPRVALKFRIFPICGTPASSQCTVIVWFVFTSISELMAGEGAANAKFAPLTVNGFVAVAPRAEAVMESVPATAAFTVTVASPLALVVGLAGLKVLPFEELIVIGTPLRPTPAESLTDRISCADPPNGRDVVPLTVTAVPVAVISVEAEAVSAVALTAIARLVLLLPTFSSAVIRPLASVTPPGATLTKAEPLGSVTLKVTALPVIVRF